MDEAVTLKDCDVYSYKSDGEDDPFGVEVPHLNIHRTNALNCNDRNCIVHCYLLRSTG